MKSQDKKQKTSSVKRTEKKHEASRADFAFGRQNYILLIIAIAFIVIGFLLMVGGGSDDPNVFNEKELFSFRRITLAPIIVLTGYVIAIFAIMKKTKEPTSKKE